MNIVYQVMKYEPDELDEDIGLFASLESARAAIHECAYLNDGVDLSGDNGTHPWYENGADPQSPTYSCEYPVGDATYDINARTVTP